MPPANRTVSAGLRPLELTVEVLRRGEAVHRRLHPLEPILHALESDLQEAGVPPRVLRSREELPEHGGEEDADRKAHGERER